MSSTLVFQYYNLQEEVTLQCATSQSDLGAALLLSGQPVAYASRAPTPTETRFAQIEKKLLAIMFACEHFEAYTYGRDILHIETENWRQLTIQLHLLSSCSVTKNQGTILCDDSLGRHHIKELADH